MRFLLRKMDDPRNQHDRLKPVVGRESTLQARTRSEPVRSVWPACGRGGALIFVVTTNITQLYPDIVNGAHGKRVPCSHRFKCGKGIRRRRLC